MKKVMISQPFVGTTKKDFASVHRKAVRYLHKQGYEIVDTIYTTVKKGIFNRPLYFLGRSLMGMSECDAVYFCEGWEFERGCKLEHEAAKEYRLEILYEKKETNSGSAETAYSTAEAVEGE